MKLTMISIFVLLQLFVLGHSFSPRNLKWFRNDNGIMRRTATTISERPIAFQRPPRILISGGPASGKGTQCELIVKDFGLVHISTGNLLREAVAQKTEIGLQVQDIMEKGDLVPDDIVINLVKDKIQSEECKKKGWLLDGFPRTLDQAIALTRLGARADFFIYLHVPDPELIKRVTGRRTDPVTGNTYHIQHDPPPSKLVEDRCIIRSDDTPEAIRRRLGKFHLSMEDIKDYYRDIFTQVDGLQKKHLVYRYVSNILQVAVDKTKGLLIEKRTIPIPGMKMGTSGLRKKVKEIIKRSDYLPNFIQSIFNALPPSDVQGGILVVGGDGRYHNKEAIQLIIKMAVANGVAEIWVAQHGLLSTPACSTILREIVIPYESIGDGLVNHKYPDINGVRKPFGSILLTASHNPGGPDGDFGLKFNTGDGAPAKETLTDRIYDKSSQIKRYLTVSETKDIKLDNEVGTITHMGHAKVMIIDPVEEYEKILRKCFDFDKIRRFILRPDFSMIFDGMNGVGGVAAKRILGDVLQVPHSCFLRCESKEDFGGTHPDPNLKYAPELLKLMGVSDKGEAVKTTKQQINQLQNQAGGGKLNNNHDQDDDAELKRIPDFGCALDGDADRNMILGKQCFITPSDSLAIIAAQGKECIKQFKQGIFGVARSMPTSKAVDVVVKKTLDAFPFETPTGWKYFANLMDLEDGEYTPLVCGEESFGTGSSHIREKDGLWAVLAWLSILAHHNSNPDKPLVSVQNIRDNHWREYGRHYYCRYDYEGLSQEQARAVIEAIRSRMIELADNCGISFAGLPCMNIEEFVYMDPLDNTFIEDQGMFLDFAAGERAVFRISGTGSDKATLRVYLENYQVRPETLFRPTEDMVKHVAAAAIEAARIEEITGMKEPFVIT